MEISQTLQWVVGVIVGSGVFFGGAGYLLSKYKEGTKEEKAEGQDLISSNEQIKEFYKKQNDDLKEINKVMGEKIEALTREVGEIRGQLNAETKQKSEYLAILQNRDPETKQFMEHMVRAMENQDKMLTEIYKMAKQEHERDFMVTATVTKQEK